MRIFYIQRTGEVRKEMCVDIDIDDNSYRYREIRSSNELTLYFSAPNFLEIPLGAWCEFQGERYTLEEPVIVTKHGEENYEYDVTMEGAQSMLKKFKFRHTLGINDTSDRSLKFDLTAKPRQHLQMLVDNLNSREGAVVWGDGRVLDSVEKHIAYNHTFCMDALNQMADAFDTEYEVVSNVICDSVGCSTPNCEIIHKQIHLHKLEYNIGNNALSIVENGVRRGLTYGKDNGFVSGVHRTNYNDKKAVGCLFVQGGERNIDSSVYGKSATDSDQAGSSVLLLPKGGSIQFDGTHFDDEVGYSASTARTYIVDAHGYSVQRVETNDHLVSKVEDSLDLSDIYPTEEHTVTKAIPTVKNEGKEDEFTNWDIIDINNTVDYKDYRIDGQIATVIFQSGMLAGKEFDLVQDKTLHGYVHAERRFKLVSQDIDGMRMPSEEGTAFTPKVGDKFKVFGVSLPTEYITKAERKMLKEAVKYLYENVDQKFTIDADIDGIWAKRNWGNISGKIVLGGYVLFYDPDLHIEDTAMRIRSIKEYIHNPYKPQIELTNTIAKGSIMNDINKIKANEVVTESNRKEAQQFAKRGFRNAQETTKMLENSLIENFTESIKPITINTMQLLVGGESLQFEFVDKVFTEGQTAPVLDANHNIGYNASTKTLTADSGVVRHLSLDVKTMSPTHKAGEYKYWTIGSSFSITNANIVDENSQPDKSGRYLYIKAHKSAGTAEYVISDVAIAMNSDKPEHANHYHFTCGILNSETNGSRDYTSMFGFTEILPGRITTDKIVSADGDTYFDLANGEIGGKITFLSGGNKKTVSQLEVDAIADATAKATKAKDDAILVSATDATNKSEASKDDLAIKMGYTSYENMVDEVGVKGTIIKGGRIRTSLIETAGLTAQYIATPGGEVAITKDKIKVGSVTVVGGGAIFVGEDPTNGLSTGVLITDETIKSIDDLNEESNSGDSSLSPDTIIPDKTYSTSISESLEGGVIGLSKGSAITVSADISAYFDDQAVIPDGTDGLVELTVYLYGGGKSYYLGGLSIDAQAEGIPVEQTINKEFLTMPAGDYILKVSTSIPTGDVNTESADYAKIVNAVISYNYVSTMRRTEIGSDGMVLAWNQDNYEHTAYDAEVGLLKKDFRGDFKYNGCDVAGVLYSGCISAGGHITRYKSFNNKIITATKVAGTTGEYRVTLPTNISDCMIMVSGNNSRYASVKTQSSNYFIVKLSGNGSFNFQIISTGGWVITQ